MIISEALHKDDFLQEHAFILKNATFLLETMLPIVQDHIQVYATVLCVKHDFQFAFRSVLVELHRSWLSYILSLINLLQCLVLVMMETLIWMETQMMK
jgi:hypothetical protein